MKPHAARHKCPDCDGRGAIWVKGYDRSWQIDCDKCGGGGYLIPFNLAWDRDESVFCRVCGTTIFERADVPAEIAKVLDARRPGLRNFVDPPPILRDCVSARGRQPLAGIETGTAETVKQGSVPKG